MRRSLPLVATLAAMLTGLVPQPSAADPAAEPQRSRPDGPGRAAQPAGRAEVADELDLTVVVPALQDAFGDRYGGYWIEHRQHDDLLHVAVVDADDEDRDTVARLTDHHPRIVVDPVTHGYDDLLAAQDEIALSMDPDEGDFTVEVDVAANKVVVRTDRRRHDDHLRGPEAACQRPAPEPRGVRPAPAPLAGDTQLPDEHVPRPPRRLPRRRGTASDLATAVEVARHRHRDRPRRPQHAPALHRRPQHLRPRRHAVAHCTSGYVFANGFGYRQHGWPLRPRQRRRRHRPAIVDVIRANGPTGGSRPTRRCSLSAHGWATVRDPGRCRWRSRGPSPASTATQIGNGLELCFQGVTSDPATARPSSGLTSDLLRRGQGVLLLLHLPSEPARRQRRPVYRPVERAAIAAGMVSSSVTVNGPDDLLLDGRSIEYILNSGS